MYKISDIAKLFQISTKTLRFYESKGLIKPTKIGNENGYRYYDYSIIPRVTKILQLKEMGFTLQEIQDIFDDNSSLHIKYKHLLEQRAMIEYQIQQYHSYIFSHEYQLYFNSEYNKNYYSKNIVAHSHEDIFENYKILLDEVIKNKGILRSPFLYYATPLSHKGMISENTDIQISIPIEAPCKGSSIHNEFVYIYTVHHGDYDTLHNAYEYLNTTIKDKDEFKEYYPMECYLTHMHNSTIKPSEYVTQVRYVFNDTEF